MTAPHPPCVGVRDCKVPTLCANEEKCLRDRSPSGGSEWPRRLFHASVCLVTFYALFALLDVPADLVWWRAAAAGALLHFNKRFL